jgi:DNA-binding response OmpR family regulator
VARGRVLIIDAVEGIAGSLADGLRQARFEVHVSATAREGFASATNLLPDCIICDPALPDLPGYWVARRVRTEPSRLATVPFVFLTEDDSPPARLQGFNVGADAYITKPYRIDDVVGQVGALLDMVERLSGARDSYAPQSSVHPSAVRGDLAHISLSTLLTLFEMERRTGRLKVRRDDGAMAAFDIVNGCVERAVRDDAEGDTVETAREVLRWTSGRFWFRAGPFEPGQAARSDPPLARKIDSITAILLEAYRRDDEAHR